MAPHALRSTNVTMNAVCPSLVATGIVDQKLIEIWPKERLTPPELVVKAYMRFIEGDENGCIAETIVDKIHLRPLPEWADDNQRWSKEEGKVLYKKAFSNVLNPQ